MNLQSSKKLGILGVALIFLDAILSGLTTIPTFPKISFYNIPRFIGIILVLISLYHLAHLYQTKTIYTNARIGAALAIIGTIIVNIVSIGILAIKTPPTAGIFLGGLLLEFVILAVFFTVAAVFVRRSLNELAARSGIDEFATAGQTLFIGAILTIIIFGTVIMGIAFLILANAFSKMKNTQLTPLSTIELSSLPQNMSTITTEVNSYCPCCGTPVPFEASFCTQCGKQI